MYWYSCKIPLLGLITKKPNTSFKLWGKEFKYPIFAGPVGAVNLHYGEKYNDASYNDVMVSACNANEYRENGL